MAYYRLYFMNKRNGHIDRFEEFEAASDEMAITRADGHVTAAPLELWSGGTKVYRLEMDQQIAAAAHPARVSRRPLTA